MPLPLGQKDFHAERETIEDQLRLQLFMAGGEYQDAKTRYQEARKLHAELGPGHADGGYALRLALKQENEARRIYTERLRAFTDFILTGKLP